MAIFKPVAIKGIYGREMFETWRKMIAMLQSGLEARAAIVRRLPAAGVHSGRDSTADGRRRGGGAPLIVDR